MKLKTSQKGMTFWGVSFILLLIGFAVFNVLKLLPVYLESFAIESSVTSMESEGKAEFFSSAMEVKNTLRRRLSMNNVTVLEPQEDISVVREGNYYLISVDYEVRVPYMSNIELLVSFKHDARVPVN